jgi:hypothetical protein
VPERRGGFLHRLAMGGEDEQARLAVDLDLVLNGIRHSKK